MPSKIRLAILDDHLPIIDGYISRLNRSPQIEVVGTASSGSEIENFLKKNNVDVLFLDVEVPTSPDNPAPYPILHLIRQWKEKYPEMAILVMSMFNEASLTNALMEAGASGYLLKDDIASIKELDTIAIAIANGEIRLSEKAFQEIHKRQAKDAVPHLTPRQLEALSIAAAHPEFSRNDLAAEMNIVGSGARNLLSQAYLRLGVNTLAAAIAKARQLGLITPFPFSPLK